MAVLAFGAAVTIGSLQYRGNLAAVRVTLAAGPGVGSARIELPRDLRADAAPGDKVTLALTGESGADTDVFTGRVSSVRHGFDSTVVVAGDASATLAGVRSGSSFEQQSGSSIISALAREADVETGTVDLDLDLPGYVAHQGRTAWEHVCQLAAWAGAVATVSPGGAVEVRPFPEPPADSALRYGREIADLTVSTPSRGAAMLFTGNGPAGNGSDPRARQQSAATLPEDAPGPDAGTIRVAAPALRTPGAATTATQAVAEHSGAPRLTATCWLVPELRPGVTVEIADAPTSGSSGPWLVTRAVHVVGPGPRGRTALEAISLQRAAGGLLDQLPGAVGGLL